MLPNGISIANPDKLFIGGTWVEPHSGRMIDLISPNSEEIIGRVAEADEADMDAAVAAARMAFDHGPWPTTPPAERIAAFRHMLSHLKGRVPELASAWTAQMGGLAKMAVPMHMGAIMDLEADATRAESFDFTQRRPSDHCAAAIVAYEPVGVVVAISPWNGPFQSMSKKICAALLAGCTVVMKPSPETPLEAYIIAEAAEAAGIPPGVVNLVPGNRDASDHLICNPSVDKVNFTGSTGVGKRIAAVCAERIGRYTLELGGKSAAIVRDDIAIEDAAKILTRTIIMMSGQICAMPSRAIVSRERHDALAAAIASEMAQIRIGPSEDLETDLGPVAMKRQLERIEMYIEEGKKTATLAYGGERPAHLNQGYFIEPTLFSNVNNSSRIAQEEIFGPVLVLIPADDEDDAIRIANDSIYGLGGTVLTNDADEAYRVARRIRTGAVGQNGLRIPFGLPLGGFKQSGIGREGGLDGLVAHLEAKAIMIDAMPQTI